MLRIDETSNTLVAPDQTALVAEAAPTREELLALISGGWQAFAAEIGQPQLRLVAAAPEPGLDLLAFDGAAGRVAVVVVGGEDPSDALSRALPAAASVAGWDAQRLAALGDELAAAVPGDSPRIVLVGTGFDPTTLTTADWLVRRHGLEMSAYLVRMLRFGSERLVEISRAYPAPDPASAAAAPDFLASVAAPAAGASAPPPSVPAA